jgi:phosphate/sulfate permease
VKVLANENCAEAYGHDCESYRYRLRPRFAFILCASVALLLGRWIDPVVAGSWLPFHASCGAITGLPCIFCGVTRALHLLLNGDFVGAIYFNWLAFPLLAVLIFLIALFAIEMAQRRVIWRLSVVLSMTRRRLTVLGLGLLLLWTLQAYLAVSQHKHELLNSHGPLYALFVR